MVLVPLPVSVAVLTPATSANLGPGFDTLGLALQLYNRFDVEIIEGDPLIPQIEVQGELGDTLSKGPDNLFFQAFALLFQRKQVDLPAVKIRMTIAIPPGCGLGSSATAVVGGLVAANELLRIKGLGVTKEELLAPAVEFEAGNHPDNVAPALLGGLVATTTADGEISSCENAFPRRIEGNHFYAIISNGYSNRQEVATRGIFQE